MTSGFCPVPGTALYYEREGSGTPVVFLHGNSLDLSVWKFQTGAFRPAYDVVAYDLRGFGRSQPAALPYTHADDLRRLLDHLEIDRAFLVGWSMGGGGAINFSLLHPDRVIAAVLVDSSLGGFTYSDAFRESLPFYNQEIVTAHGIESAKERVLRHPFIAASMRNPEAALLLTRAIRGYSGWHWTNVDAGVPLNPSALERLAEIAVPVLAMVGEHDVDDFHAIAELIAERVPRARRLVVPGAGHAPFLDSPAAFNRLVMEFFETLL